MMTMIYLIDRVKAESNLSHSLVQQATNETTTKGKVTINHRENSQDTNHIKDNIC